MKKTFILTITAAALLCGCAGKPPVAKLPTMQIYNAPKDKVWPLVVSEIGAEIIRSRSSRRKAA